MGAVTEPPASAAPAPAHLSGIGRPPRADRRDPHLDPHLDPHRDAYSGRRSGPHPGRRSDPRRDREPAPAAVRPRLIATDLDGTLLRGDKSVSERTVAALAAAEAAGIEVFFVTGRPPRWMGVVSDHVPGHGLAICSNGAAVVDLHGGGRPVRERPLPRADAVTVVRALRAAVPDVSFAVETRGAFLHEPQYPIAQFEPGAAVAPVERLLAEDGPEAGADGGRSGSGTGTAAGTGREYGHGPVWKVLAHSAELGPDEFLQLARAVAGAHAQFTRSSPTALLEISGRGVSKASTLEQCCAERGIGAEEVVAFGDMPNDLEMLGWAATSYAMANAHPEVLAATSLRTASNEEDGVAVVIEKLLADSAARHDVP